MNALCRNTVYAGKEWRRTIISRLAPYRVTFHAETVMTQKSESVSINGGTSTLRGRMRGSFDLFTLFRC